MSDGIFEQVVNVIVSTVGGDFRHEMFTDYFELVGIPLIS